MRRHDALLRMASLAVPVRLRCEWLRTWQSELFYVPQSEATAFCLGAAKDAGSLWREGSGGWLDSPYRYLAVLSASSAAVYCAGLCAAKVALSLPLCTSVQEVKLALLLFFLLISVGAIIGKGQGAVWPAGFRDGAFLGLKLVMGVPIFYGVLFLGIALGIPVLHPMVIYVFVVRAIFADQRRRCPRCLRYLGSPVAIGSAAETFLHWYGTESICVRCCALMEMPDVSCSYWAEHRLLPLDSSWAEVFSEQAEARS